MPTIVLGDLHPQKESEAAINERVRTAFFNGNSRPLTLGDPGTTTNTPDNQNFLGGPSFYANTVKPVADQRQAALLSQMLGRRFRP